MNQFGIYFFAISESLWGKYAFKKMVLPYFCPLDLKEIPIQLIMIFGFYK